MRLSAKQLEVATWWSVGSGRSSKDGVIAEGAVRSGKTVAMLIGFLLWSQRRFRGADFIVAGRTIGSLKRNVVSPMLDMMTAMGWRWGYNRSEGVVEVGGNRYHLFGASNEKSQDVLQGMTAAGCLADEVALFPRSFVDQMAARCSVEGSKLWFNCNPSFPSHFFKTEWIDRADELNLLHLHFTMDDNPSLSESIRTRYERMYTGVFRSRYILGLWTRAEGLVYPDHEKALEDRWTGKPRRWAVSVDYGTQNPFAALLWACDGHAWHLVDEWSWSGREKGVQKTDSAYADEIERMLRGKPEGTPVIVDPSAASFIAELRGRGVKVRKARNDVLDGIRETATCLESGAVRVWRGCERTVSEFGAYSWGEGDAPIKEDDHAMDAMRYLVATLRLAKRVEEGYEPKIERRPAAWQR